MGFININDQSGTTTSNSSLGTSGNTSTTIESAHSIGGLGLSYSISYSIHQGIYHVLGEDIKVEGYVDSDVAISISTLNILGKPFYDQLKKNNVYFPKEIEYYLEQKFKILERDRKIENIIK
jgi:hypothetical protein